MAHANVLHFAFVGKGSEQPVVSELQVFPLFKPLPTSAFERMGPLEPLAPLKPPNPEADCHSALADFLPSPRSLALRYHFRRHCLY